PPTYHFRTSPPPTPPLFPYTTLFRSLERNHQLELTLVNGQVRSPEEIGQVVIKNTPAGIPVRVGDVATVSAGVKPVYTIVTANRSEEHTSELQSHLNLVCRLLLEKKK